MELEMCAAVEPVEGEGAAEGRKGYLDKGFRSKLSFEVEI